MRIVFCWYFFSVCLCVYAYATNPWDCSMLCLEIFSFLLSFFFILPSANNETKMFVQCEFNQYTKQNENSNGNDNDDDDDDGIQNADDTGADFLFVFDFISIRKYHRFDKIIYTVVIVRSLSRSHSVCVCVEMAEQTNDIFVILLRFMCTFSVQTLTAAFSLFLCRFDLSSSFRIFVLALRNCASVFECTHFKLYSVIISTNGDGRFINTCFTVFQIDTGKVQLVPYTLLIDHEY